MVVIIPDTPLTIISARLEKPTFTFKFAGALLRTRPQFLVLALLGALMPNIVTTNSTGLLQSLRAYWANAFYSSFLLRDP